MTQPEPAFNPEATAVLTVHTTPAFNQQLQNACEQRGWVANFSNYESYLSGDRRAALSSLRGAPACVAFIDFDQDLEKAVESVHYLGGALSAPLTIIAVSQQQNPATMLAAMRAGCKEFLCLSSGPSALFDVLEQLETRTERAPRAAHQEASVFSFFGVKGGVGTTSLAVHLAFYLKHLSKKRVLLIDHQVELGEVCLYLGVDGLRSNFSECIRSVGRLDSELLRGFVARHASGLEILSSPDNCHGARPLDPEALARTLEFLRSEYDYVLIDCLAPTAAASEPILQASTAIFLVTTPEVGAIRNLSRLMEVLGPLDSCREKIQIVMNRATAPEALTSMQIEKAMKLTVKLQLASAPVEMAEACNLGRPIAPDSRLPLVQQLTRWAGSIAGIKIKAAPAPKASRPFLSFLQPSRQPATERS